MKDMIAKYFGKFSKHTFCLCILIACCNAQYAQQKNHSQTGKGNIVGKWRIDPKDEKAIELSGDVSFEFTKDGKLIYTIHEVDKKSIINMTYTIEGNKIITDQPSAPRKQVTEFRLKGDTLELNFAGQRGRFYRLK